MTDAEKVSYDRIVNSKDFTPKQKVGIVDYLRTPTKVLEKVGLGKEARMLEKAHDGYLKDLETEINRITDWAARAPGQESSRQIFKYLDGQKVTLNPQELKVAGEVRAYLDQWADKLGLPQDGRIAKYITHIFEQDFIQKEFDPDLVKIIADKIPGSVYDPFLEQRLGKQGYVEDTWRALDAYVKRATRKYNMDPALEQLKASAESHPLETYDYVKSLADRVNLRPDKIDTLADNTIKSMIGYRGGQRPLAKYTRIWRNMVYRGALGLNVGSAVRNLTQGVNTYAKLGEKYTVLGYMDLVRNWTGNNLKELKDVGVLRDNMIQDRTISATKNKMEKLEKGLWVMFDAAEKINRGSAYFGAKRQALDKGMSEAQAVDFAKKIVKDTQFTFGNIDTPVALGGDLMKTLAQFQSYNVKQVEFLTDMAKNKELGGIARYAAGTALMISLLGEVLGYTWDQAIPFSDIVTGEGKFSSPAAEFGKGLLNTAFGDEQRKKEGQKQLQNTAKLLIPTGGGVQAGKTIEGLDAYNKGYSETGTTLDKIMGKEGAVRYPIEKTPGNLVKTALFGQYSTPEAREYFNQDRRPLGEKDSAVIRLAPNKTEAVKTIRLIQDKNKERGTSASGDDKAVQEATRIWRDHYENGLPLNEVSTQLSQLGVDPIDARREYLAKSGTAEDKLDYVLNQFEKKPEVQTLIKLKAPVGKKVILSDEAVREIQKEGQIDFYDRDRLIDGEYKDGKFVEPELGMSREDYNYHKFANQDTDTKIAQIKGQLNSLPEDQQADYLISLTKRSKLGSYGLNDNILEALYQDGTLTAQEANLLAEYKKKATGYTFKGGSGGKKAKKATMGSTSPYNFKITQPKTVTIARPKVAIRLKQPTIAPIRITR